MEKRSGGLQDCRMLLLLRGGNESRPGLIGSEEIPTRALFNLCTLLKSPLSLRVSTVSKISMTTIMMT